jgi:hypothetical protein
MMTRPQRIEYEILDCAINGARGADDGYATTLAAFLQRLQELFPGIEAHEFTDACMRLVEQNALRLSKLDKTLGRSRDHQRARDNIASFLLIPKWDSTSMPAG